MDDHFIRPMHSVTWESKLLRMSQRPGQSIEDYKTSLVECAMKAFPEQAQQRMETLKKVIFTGLSPEFLPLMKDYIYDHPKASFNQIMDRLAFVGSTLPSSTRQEDGIYKISPDSGQGNTSKDEPSLLAEVMETLKQSTESMTKSIDRMTSGMTALKEETHKSISGSQETNKNISKMSATLLNKMTAKPGNPKDPKPVGRGKYFPKKGSYRKPSDPTDQKPEKPGTDLRTCFSCGKQGHFARVCPNKAHYACREYCLRFINPQDYEGCLACEGVHGYGFLAACPADVGEHPPILDLREDDALPPGKG